jgi:hypothetical protein
MNTLGYKLLISLPDKEHIKLEPDIKLRHDP